MSTPDPIGSNSPPDTPANPTHFGGAGLYDPGAEQSSSADTNTTGSMWQAAKRYHVPAVLAVSGIAWLLAILVRRSTSRV